MCCVLCVVCRGRVVCWGRVVCNGPALVSPGFRPARGASHLADRHLHVSACKCVIVCASSPSSCPVLAASAALHTREQCAEADLRSDHSYCRSPNSNADHTIQTNSTAAPTRGVAKAWHFGEGVFCAAGTTHNWLLLKHMDLFVCGVVCVACVPCALLQLRVLDGKPPRTCALLRAAERCSSTTLKVHSNAPWAPGAPAAAQQKSKPSPAANGSAAAGCWPLLQAAGRCCNARPRSGAP